MKNSQYFFWFIVFLTIASILIVLPSKIPVNIETGKIPLLNRSISVHHEFLGFNPNFFLAPLHIKKDLAFRRGLDLEGGTSITLKADMKGIPEAQRVTALTSSQNVIQKRIDALGVLEPIVQTATGNNDYRIIVELPGITDVQKAASLVGRTAKLEFRSVNPSASQSAVLSYADTSPTGLTGADLKDSQASFDQRTSAPVVLFSITDSSQDKFFKNTQKLLGKQMAICLDQECFSAPVVQQAIRDSGQISGNFTVEQANELATQLNAGALPVSLSVLQINTIGATLGVSSLEKSLFAGCLGFLIIVIFMSILYGRLGLLASLALFLYTLFTLALFKLIPVTLTLAGIAGFILSIGMAVDANILIFERMREELRKGKSRDIAIELGFSRAWTSIRDSNVASIITSLILISFGTGIVRGFAITLLVGVLVSMFSAIVVTRTFLRVLYKDTNKL